MEICNKSFVNKIFFLFIFFIFSGASNADVSFENLKSKKVSYLDFFLLKFENKLLSRSQILRQQAIPTRVQYSHIGTNVEYDKKKNKIFITIKAIMNKHRYQKKKYNQKLSDCNQVRNLIFYQVSGYKFFTQKRDPVLSTESMKKIFKEVFFENTSFDQDEMNFIINRMQINVTIFHPVKKIELTCAGNINDYELQ